MRSAGCSLFFLLCASGLTFGAPLLAHANTESEIQAQIDANNKQVDALRAEIATFQRQLDAVGAKKSTLQSTVNGLTLSQKQLASQIKVTQSKISSATLRIKQLSLSINDKASSISLNEDAISKELRRIAEHEEVSLLAKLISADSLGDAWRTADQAMQFNRALANSTHALRRVKTALGKDRDAVTDEKTKLLALQRDLTLQKRSVDASKAAQTQILAQTKNQEANYQRLIAQKQAAEKAFEQELVNLQGQLDLVVHPDLLPKVGSGVLSWPFSNAFMFNCTERKKVFGNIFCITQYFGNTAFSAANSKIYNGHGHNAIDISTPIGTPIYSAMGGTVLDTGNTDLVRGCYSFGKWVMIVHGNGLSTLYSHLSEIDVSKGQQVATKQLVGLSGMTGYATGPHLHFGVYATEGTQIMTLKQFRGATAGCANAKMPVATLPAYLNPLSYL